VWLGRFLAVFENETILVLDSRVLHVGIFFVVRPAVMLGLDDDGAELSEVSLPHHHVCGDWDVETLSTKVAEQHR
jgi:hypothetical protein